MVRKMLAICVVAMLVAAPASAEKMIIDRVLAVVEDEAIFLSDVDMMVRQWMFQQRRTTLTDQEQQDLSGRILQDLINDKLVIAQASRLGVDVSFADVEERVNHAIDENKRQLGETRFAEQLAREGFTLDSLKKMYRRQFRNQMLVERVIRMDMAQKTDNPTAAELRKFYDEHQSELPARPEVVHLQTILIEPEGSGASEESAREKLVELRARIEAGEPFADVARANSQDPSSEAGGDLGFINPNDLRDLAFRQAVDSLAEGEVSQPVRTEYGYHLITVGEHRDNGEVQISHILLRVDASDEDTQKAFREANDVHDQLAAGTLDFQAAADAHSDDPTAGPGGDLGWLKVGDLPEFFQEVLTGMKPGDISHVMRESSGFRIVKLVEREAPRPFAFDEIQNELRQMYINYQMNNRFADYIAGLRDKFSVVIKSPTE